MATKKKNATFICIRCKELFTIEEDKPETNFIKIGNRKYCQACAEIKQKEEEEKARKARCYTCVSCKQEFEPDPEDESTNPVLIGNRKYCKHCAEIHNAELEQKAQEKEEKDKENAQLLDLKDYMNEHPALVNRQSACWPMVMRGLRHLTQTDKFKYKGIKMTLQYVYDNRENGIKKIPDFDMGRNLIWIVEDYYPIVKKHELEIRECRNKAAQIDIVNDILNVKPKYLEIDPDQMEKLKTQRLEKIKNDIYGPAIDINDIVDDGEVEEIEDFKEAKEVEDWEVD